MARHLHYTLDHDTCESLGFDGTGRFGEVAIHVIDGGLDPINDGPSAVIVGVQLPIIRAKDLDTGHRFHSPREDEGMVTVVHPYGTSQGRPDSVHVRNTRGGEFFIALVDRELIVLNTKIPIINRHAG